VDANKPNQSPNEEKAIACQSFLNAGIAKTLRDCACAGADGYGNDML